VPIEQGKSDEHEHDAEQRRAGVRYDRSQRERQRHDADRRL
jgi:hypothetical protein